MPQSRSSAAHLQSLQKERVGLALLIPSPVRFIGYGSGNYSKLTLRQDDLQNGIQLEGMVGAFLTLQELNLSSKASS